MRFILPAKILQRVFVCRVACMHCCMHTTSYELHLLCIQNCHFIIEKVEEKKSEAPKNVHFSPFIAMFSLYAIRTNTDCRTKEKKIMQKNQCNTNICIKASAVYFTSCISLISYLLKFLILSLSVAQLCTANASVPFSFLLSALLLRFVVTTLLQHRSKWIGKLWE